MADRKHILVIEDHPEVREIVSRIARNEGYECFVANDGQEGIDKVRRLRPHLVVLDRNLPEKSGEDVLREIRSNPETAEIPVIMLTGKADDDDELVGFAIGADDYVRKPFLPKLLMARVDSLLRRSEQQRKADETAKMPRVVLDQRRHVVIVDQSQIPLDTLEYALLAALISGRGMVLSRALLKRTLTPASASPMTETVLGETLAALRKKLGPASEYVQEIPDVGVAFYVHEGSHGT